MEEKRHLSKCKSSSSYWFALILGVVVVLVVGQIQGGCGCIEEERKALLEIKASLKNTYGTVADYVLPTWVDHGSPVGGCCDWERVTCNKTTGHVTQLSLGDMRQITNEDYSHKIWPLNMSIFLHFKKLASLNLEKDYLDNGIEKTGLKRLSSLKRLEMLNLGSNYIENNSIFSSLGAITSLRILDLSDNQLGGHFPAHETFNGGFQRLSKLRKLETLNLGYNYFDERLIPSLSAFPSLKVLNLCANNISGSFPAQELANFNNLEQLELSSNRFNDSLTIQGCKSLSRLIKLESVALRGNSFNKSIISCLSALPSLKILDLRRSTRLGSSFPGQELSVLRKLTTLKLDSSGFDSLEFNGTMSRLMHLDLSFNRFNKEITSSLGAFPSLKFLSLRYCDLKGVFSTKALPNLEVLLLSDNELNGVQGLASLHHLEVLDLSSNGFVGSIPSSIQALSSLKVLSFAGNGLNGSLPIQGFSELKNLEELDLSLNMYVGGIPSSIQALSSLKVLSFALNELNGTLPSQGFCELKNLQELDLSQNMFEGNLPPCFSSLSSLKLFDLSLNQFSGNLPSSMIHNLTSLEYIDLSYNKFEGSFSFSSFSTHQKLEVVELISDNDKFEVETEEPSGWIPEFQLKVLVLSNCNLNRLTSSVPSFLLHQHKLRVLDLSHNSLGGTFPNWLMENNTMMEVFNVRNNSFGGALRMPSYRNVNTWWLDMSGNQLNGTIPADIGKVLPYITNLNLTDNALNGVLPLSIGDLSELQVLDLSNNDFTGELPKRLLTDISQLSVLKLSNNRFGGEVLSRKFSMASLMVLMLDNNRFTGVLTNEINLTEASLSMLDISNNMFSGLIPGWISNLTTLNALLVRNNKFEGQFPCGTAAISFLDISENSFSGSIPSCLNMQYVEHLHLNSNRFSGSIPQSFSNLSNVLTLDMGNNNLSGRIPNFFGEFYNLRILLLRGNHFSGPFPNQLCQLHNVSLMDISSNSLSGSIPQCLQYITGPNNPVFLQSLIVSYGRHTFYQYNSTLQSGFNIHDMDDTYGRQDEVQFITKSRPDTYKGGILDYMSGLDLSCNKLTGEIPEELGFLTHIHALNLSHNHLTGPIPRTFSNLTNIESLDLSWNGLSGKIPSELSALNYLAVFIVAENNLSGSLPEMKGQFGTFSQDSYEGNLLLCGPPLLKKCTPAVPNQTLETPAEEHREKWYDIDLVYFYASLTSTWFVFLLGFAGLLYTNPYWRRRWLDFVEECMYTFYYFLCDSARKLSKLLHA